VAYRDPTEKGAHREDPLWGNGEPVTGAA